MNCKPGWWTVETVQEHWSWVEKCGQWTQVQLGTGKYTGGENLKDSDAVVYIQVFVKDWNRSHANRFRWNNLKQILGVREKQSIECCSGALNHILTLKVTTFSLRWLQWKDQKATVGRLTKVLFNHREYEALSCLQPWKLQPFNIFMAMATTSSSRTSDIYHLLWCMCPPFPIERATNQPRRAQWYWTSSSEQSILLPNSVLCTKTT